MPYRTVSALAAFLLAAPALAGGDPAAGEKAFRQCQACHVVRNGAGEVLAGKTAKTGPNLYGLPGRVMGSEEGFAYSDAFEEAQATGRSWDEEAFVTYVQDPNAYLSDMLEHKSRSKMTFRLREEQDARDLWAYFSSLE
ncbi:cytochrome c family protein [Mangrovicoccus sp. HB161399]|uniref:c-type cytochrome n=1 Tax=Mangrovicoccus sp. HB161399 TaxID=2720392 RepID=UPI0015553AB0|nr:c-type cytochrome [Mangrovicoccus sp. HB161399]